MDNSKIYEEIMLNSYFNKVKYIRNGWKDEEKPFGLATIMDVGESDYRSYNYIMERCDSIIYEMIPQVIIALFEAYGIHVQYYDIKRNEVYVFSAGEKNVRIILGNQEKTRYLHLVGKTIPEIHYLCLRNLE